MQRVVIGEDERVSLWLARALGDDSPNPTVTPSIGIERDGFLVAAACFDAMEPNNLYAHIASAVFPVPPALLREVARYAYQQCGVERLTFRIDEHNTPCVRFVEKMGAKLEARLARAHGDRDTLLYVLWKDEDFLRRLAEKQE